MEPFKFPQKFYQKADSGGGGLASTLAGGLSFLSPVMGALGIGGNILSWILGNDKFDWKKWAEEQKAQVATDYDSSLKKMEQRTANLADATIGQTSNIQSMAGSVAGMSGAGTGRMQAQTYANIAGQRDQAIASITNAMENQKANALAAIDRQAGQGSMAEDFNAPTTLDYASNFVKSLQAGPAQDFLGTLFGGGYLGIKSLFNKGNTTPNLTPDKTAPSGNKQPISPAQLTPNPVTSGVPINTGDNDWVVKAAGILGNNLPIQNMITEENNPFGNLFGYLSQNSLNPVKMKYLKQQKEWGY